MWTYVPGDTAEYRGRELRASAHRVQVPRQERERAGQKPTSRTPLGDLPRRSTFGWKIPNWELPDQPLGLRRSFW